MNIEQFISIDTNQVLMEEADKLMEEYEQQKIDQLNQRMAELEAINAELLEALKSALDLCRFYREAGSCETCIAKRTCNIYNAINKAEVDGR